MNIEHIMAVLKAPEPQTRDRARWKLLKAFLKEFDSWAPKDHPVTAEGVPLEMPVIVARLVGLTAAERTAVLEDDVPGALAFGQWREAVTRLEALNAQRLMVLVDFTQFALTRYELAEGEDSRRAIAGALRGLERLLAPWGVSPSVETDGRAQAPAWTRRYDLLPRALRWLPRREGET